MNSLVSIVIPVYNKEKFIKQCVESCMNQTYKNLEILCVDDGSTDKSIEIMSELVEQDSRVHLLHHMHTVNCAAGARNMGLENAKGEYILFLDADDWIEPNCIEVAYRVAIDNDLDITIFNYKRFNSSTNRYSNSFNNIEKLPHEDVFNYKTIKRDIFQIVVGYVWTNLYRRNLIGSLRFQEIPVIDDRFFAHMLLVEAQRIMFIPIKLINYRVGEESSQTYTFREEMMLSEFKAQEMIKQGLIDRNKYDEVKESFLKKSITYIIHAFNRDIEAMGVNNCKKLYELIHNNLGYIDDEEISYVDYKNEKYLKEYFYIKENSFDKFVYEYYVKNRYDFIIPEDLIKKDDKVILYGAGNVGKDYFSQIISKDFCVLVSWCDAAWEKIGYPIENIEIALKKNFNKVIVAIENENTANIIAEELQNIWGIKKDKIVWGNPILRFNQ